MGYKDPIKRKEYNKLLRRRQRGSKLDEPNKNKTILEQISNAKSKSKEERTKGVRTE